MKDVSNMLKISVIGGSKVDADIYELACQVGKEIARKKAILVCGGLTGVMEAACRGAKEEGGLTIGILPGCDESQANKYVDIKIVTGMGFARNIHVVLSGHAVIAVDGSYGTLSEIAYALIYNKPIIALKTWELKSYLIEGSPSIYRAETAKEAIETAIRKAEKYHE